MMSTGVPALRQATRAAASATMTAPSTSAQRNQRGRVMAAAIIAEPRPQPHAGRRTTTPASSGQLHAVPLGIEDHALVVAVAGPARTVEDRNPEGAQAFGERVDGG